jgi:hypothetical protein
VNRKYVFFVYDIRTQMTDFVASFAVREHAEFYGKMMFGEHAYISDRGLHQSGKMWDGTPWPEWTEPLPVES